MCDMFTSMTIKRKIGTSCKIREDLIYDLMMGDTGLITECIKKDHGYQGQGYILNLLESGTILLYYTTDVTRCRVVGILGRDDIVVGGEWERPISLDEHITVLSITVNPEVKLTEEEN